MAGHAVRLHSWWDNELNKEGSCQNRALGSSFATAPRESPWRRQAPKGTECSDFIVVMSSSSHVE